MKHFVLQAVSIREMHEKIASIANIKKLFVLFYMKRKCFMWYEISVCL